MDQQTLLPRFQRTIMVHDADYGVRGALEEMHKGDYSVDAFIDAERRCEHDVAAREASALCPMCSTVLDMNAIRAFLDRDIRVVARLSTIDPEAIFVTIVSFEETNRAGTPHSTGN